LAGSAITVVKRNRVGCEASPGPSGGVSPAAELVAMPEGGIVAKRIGVNGKAKVGQRATQNVATFGKVRTSA